MRAASANVEQKRYVVTADQLPRFFSDYAAGRITDPSDPRGSGMQGAYPGLLDRAPYALPRRLYQNVGIFRTIVDLPADDIWSKGWDVVATNDAIAARVRDVDMRLKIKRAYRQATRLARRDGVAIVRYRLRDSTGDPSQPPAGVRGILRVEALPRDCIVKVDVDEDPDSDRFERPLYFHLRARSDSDAYARVYTASLTTPKPAPTIKTHWERVVLVIQHPKEGDEDDGESVLSWILGDAQGHENIKFYAAEGFAQRNVPPLVVTVDKDLGLDPDNNPDDKKKLDELDQKVEKLVSGLLQKIRIGGATIEPLIGSERINAPDTYSAMFLREVLAGARVPQREITGDPAGALAAASWDVKRYFGRIANDQEDFATPLVREEHYARLDRWGIVPGLLAAVKSIAWKPHLELGEKERADVLDVTLRAVETARRARVPIPDEVAQLVTWPDDFDPHEIVDITPPAPAFAPQGPPPADRRARDPQREARAELPRGLKTIEDKLERALRDAYAAWRKRVDDAVGLATKEAQSRRPLAQRVLRREAEPTPTDVLNSVIQIQFESEDLVAALQDALIEAGELGLLRQWADLSMKRSVRAFVNSPRATVIRQFAQNLGAAKARQMSEELRNTVADTIAQGGGLAEVKTAITERFGVLENRSAIARTESMRGLNAGSLDAMEQAGVASWEFAAYPGADNDDPNGPCVQRNGEVFSIHDVENTPPIHVNCRCVPIPVLPEVA